MASDDSALHKSSISAEVMSFNLEESDLAGVWSSGKNWMAVSCVSECLQPLIKIKRDTF